ncbi:MAG: HNH endonuclease signature motif containing protein [Bacteroidales bacterium]
MNFKIILNCPTYRIYDNGAVFSIKNGIFLKQTTNGNGYWKVGMYSQHKFYQAYIHRLVAEAFIPNPNNYKYVDHIDRDKMNNTVENLRWVTAKENTDNLAGKKRYSVSKKGKPHYDTLIIEKIKQDYINGMEVMQISRRYNIPRQSISRFIKGL